MQTITTIDEYIAQFNRDTAEKLAVIRKTIHDAAPLANEAMKYGIPTFVYKGNLVHFAAYEKHIGFYPAPSGITTFKEELKEYKTAKGSVQFPHDKLLPLELIHRIVKFRVDENIHKNKK